MNNESDEIFTILTMIYVTKRRYFFDQAKKRGITIEQLAAAAIAQLLGVK